MYCRNGYLYTLAICLFLLNTACGNSTKQLTCPTAQSRDKVLWPFAPTSPWNMPIGSRATYQPAGFQRADWIAIDRDYFYWSGTLRELRANGEWPAKCTGHTLIDSVRIPNGALIMPEGKNSASAFLMPDGRTIVQGNPTARCDSTGPVYVGWSAPTEDIFGDGLHGGHGGSGLSSIGGTLRLGELTSRQCQPAYEPVIRHVLKVDIDARRYCSRINDGYRWPAARSDEYSATEYDRYGTAVPGVRMGALLALPADLDLASLQLQTEPARRLACTFQDYGAYVADDAGWHVFYLCVENGVPEEFQRTYGYDIEATEGPWYEDMMRIFTHLCVVDNNSVENVGGGGQPRQPLAPPFRN
ncbi:MAG: hypothetical protein WC734_00285 [Patescibacteria group bacterium]